MNKFFHISHSHKEATEFYREMDLKETPEERIADMNYLRGQYFKIKGLKEDFNVKKAVTVLRRQSHVK